jgi:hypothetical protein
MLTISDFDAKFSLALIIWLISSAVIYSIRSHTSAEFTPPLFDESSVPERMQHQTQLPSVHSYGLVRYYTFEEQEKAAYSWHRLATRCGIKYYFGGNCGAQWRFERYAIPIRKLTIVADGSMLADNLAVLKDISGTLPESLTIDDDGRLHIVFGGHDLPFHDADSDTMELEFEAAGGPFYPPFETLPHGAFRGVALKAFDEIPRPKPIEPYDNWFVPVLTCGSLLKVKLSQLELDSVVHDTRMRSFDDLEVIKHLIREAVRSNFRFSAAEVREITPKVYSWIRWGEMDGLPLTHQEKDWLLQLGIDVSEEPSVGVVFSSD